MKKTLSVILSLIMVFSMFALGGVTSTAAEIDGEFGENFQWSYSDYDNVLRISNSVAAYMENFSYSDGSYNRPWEAFIHEISSVVIENALSIGNYAFAGCENLTSISFRGDNLTVIGQGAFQSCVNLRNFYMPKTVIAIGPSAFEGCINLGLVKMDRYVTYIGDNAFEGCPIEFTLYSGTPDQEEFIYFEDNTESLKNVIHANMEYDVSVQIGEYAVLTAISLEPFTFTTKDASIADILETEYGTITEGGVEYYYGAAAVSGIGEGITSIYALDSNKEIIGVFSALVGRCDDSHCTTNQYCVWEATCYRGDLYVFECGYCSYKWTRFFDPKPHSYVYETEREATCLVGKLEKGVCSVCKAQTKRDTSPTGHHVERIYQQDSTCQETGYVLMRCKNCGEEYKNLIEKIDHNWTDWEVTVAPTEETEGKKERHCTMCEEKQTEVIPSLSTLMGDVNGDGKVSAFDARIVLQFAAETKEMDEHQFKLADINEDGKITAFDARRILQIAANS